MVVGAFGLLALVLASVGLYGVVSYSVSRRRHEVGIRLAVGATPGQVLRLVLVQGIRLAVVGTIVGSLFAAAAAQLLESLLYGVSAIDPIAFGVASMLLLLVAVIANLVPALAASRVDPLHALRAE
jgi:ABC-type antimicrobial peptide transport system permease subunit